MFDYERIVNRLTTMVETTARMDPGEINEFENLIELGADSMILTDVNGLIREEFGVEIPMTLFFSDLTSIREIADYIYQQQETSSPAVSQEEVVEEQAETEEIEPIKNQQRQTVMDEVWAANEQFSSAPVSASENGLQQLFSQQLAVINQQLQLLSPQQEVAATVVKTPDPAVQKRNEQKPPAASPRSVVEQPEKKAETKQKSYVPFQKLNLARKDKDPKQEQQLQELIQKYNQKTPSSKQYAENYRDVYADWRNIAGFKPNIKEMVYQLVFEDSKGSHITDIDGNEYIDLAMDFGVSLFGHNPDFIKNAIVEETAQGFPLSLISRLSGEVAQLISEMTGVERVSFFNSGTEAVMVAIRLARAITGKDKIVIFSGSYHGTFDGVLGMDAMSKEKGSASPIAGGILQSYIDGLYVLEYGHPESLAFIEEHREEIAGVLVEPVQSRRPDLQPREFLHQLRDVTLKTGIQLIFDEMILGFRLGPGGAQQFFNVEADLVTYGKIVGGGMPIGIVAGKHEVMDCLDGGMWHYGDDSTPPFENKRTFAGGTFCHHPLTMAAAKAVLLKIKEESHDIYPALAAKTKYLADTLNEFFQEHEVPAEIVYCESLFRFVLRGNMELFYYHLLSEGVYIWEGRNCFLSAAHTDDDIEDVIRIVKETCLKMKTVFFAKKSEDSKKNNKVPLTHQQQEMLASEVVHPSTSAFNQPVLLNIQGTLDRQALEQALRSISKRHEALRYTVSDDLECLKVGEPAKLDLTELEVRSEEEQEVISDCIHTSLDVQNGPLIKVFLLQPPDQQEQTKLLVIAHHLIMDGWSISVFCEELIEAYNSQLQNRAPSFREVLPYSEYRRQREKVLQSMDEEKIKSFWREYLPSYPTQLRLPQRDPLTMSEHNKEGSRFTYRLDTAFLKKIRKLAANVKSSPFLVLLTTYQFMLREISQQNDFMIGVPIAGQQACATRSLIGDCVSMVPLHVQLNQDSNMATAVAKNQAIFQKFEKMHHATLHDFTGNEDFVQPELTILFNMDRMPKNNHFLGTETELLPIQVQNVGYDLFFNLTEFQGEIIFDIDFNTNKISEAMVTRWMQLYIDLLEQICNQPNFSLYEVDVYSEDDEKIRKQAIEQANWDELAKTLQINEQDMEINAGNFTAYVLSEDGKPVPTNSYGLLYIGSDRLALYPTGWIARFTANRELELFGPEERCFYEGKTFVSLWLVEQVIGKHPDICEVTVKRTRDQQSLEAYITWATEEGVKSDLPKWCQSKLPFAFIPHRFYQEVGDGQAAILLEFANEALNHEEQIVFDIVKDLIGNGHFHKDDHLMSLGMNSLNLLKLISTLQEVYDGIRIPMSMLVEELTVENIAKTIRSLGEEGQAEAIPQIAPAVHYETSAPQQRMYVIHTLNKESLNYNLPSVVKVAGEFDIEKFKAAANACLQRHEILRTTYEQVDGEIVQIVNEQVELPVDFKEITTEVAEDELIQQMTAEFVRPFDLQKAPLMRMKIVKRSEQLHYIFFDFHHISFDGSSALIFAQEMMSAYQDKALAPLPIQYKDFAHWQNKQEQSEEMKSQQQYWQELLQTASLNCGFPTDFTRPLERTYAGHTIEYQLDQKLKARITDFCRERECTPYSFFLSTLNILVSIYSGQADVTIGTLVHGRNHRDIEGLIGMFVNTLPMVHSVPPEQTYAEYVKHVQKSVMQTFAHADVPFDQIVELAGTKNDIGRNPLFDVMFSYQDFDQLSILTDQATFEYQDLLPDDSKFDTEFEVIDQEEGYTITLQYATELYREASIQRILQHFVTLIDQILSNPAANLTEYQILTKQERQELLQFNNQDHSYSEKTIIDLFEDWAVKTPDKIAVADEEHELTYQQLNEQANHIARLYMNLGLEEEDIVGIMLERSPQLISSVVGAWKAGGAYLPLDLAHPMQRRIDILHEANVKFVVTLSEYVEDEFREAYKGKIIYLDQIELDLSHSCENLGKQVSPTNLAYILFTSGSTGKPKGVMIEHQGMLNHILAEQNDLKLDDKLVFAQNANQTFDISVWQLFGPLALGGKTVIYAQKIVLEPEKFVRKIAADKITLLEIVPSYLAVMLDELETQKHSFPSLQSLIITGETVPPHIVDRWFQSYPNIEVINAYGPAEASDDVSQYRLSTMEDGLSRVPIGQPLRNIRIYILDQYNRLCPPGVAGELCVAGIAVGRGYVNSPEKTRQVFCEDPFTERKTEREKRMYRTGDLARWLPNGQLEYLGRMDNQVKIRGFRIEPGEIEAVIRKQIGIQEVAVVAKKDHADDLTLCAYLVADETSEIEKDHLKAAIRKELPEYMVPDHFMMLEQLPVTSNGKLDQKRLPDPQFDRETSILEPRTETERVLVEIYQDVLGVNQISVDDHFFEQGGHSLKATKVMNQIEVRLGIRLPLKTIFTHPTVEQLGQQIALHPTDADTQPITKVEEQAYYPVSSQQKRLYLIHEMGEQGTVYNMPALLELAGQLDREKVERTCAQLSARHEALRTTFTVVDGEPVQHIASTLPIEVEWSEHESLDEAQAQAAFTGFVRPFDLAHGPLFRVKVLQGPTNSYLFFDMHHIISDGESINILTKEFSELYNGVELEPLTVHYKDYSHWLAQKDLQTQKDYWVDQFADEVPVLDLPTDYPRPRKQSFQGTTLSFTLGQEIKKTVDKLCEKTDTTEYMVLLSAFMVLLQKYSGQEDIVVGSPISGRLHHDTETMLGMFVNTLAMRGQPVGEKSFNQFLQEMKETTLQAYEHQEYPFEELVEQVNVQRDLSRNPIFDCVFVLQNQGEEEITLSGTPIKSFDDRTDIAKFDLTLTVHLTEHGYKVEWEYCTDLFTAEAIERLACHYQRLLEQFSQSIATSIQEIDIVTETEKQQLLEAFNQKDINYPREKTIKDLFEEQAKANLQQIAVVFEDDQITYEELNQRANRIANHLLAKNVASEEIIAVMLDRGIDLVATLLGIVKAGYVYLPIDPENPDERVEYILQDSQAAMLIQQQHQNRQIEFAGETVGAEELVADGNPDNPNVEIHPDQLLYVIYTSGTTGNPKGVLIEHRNVVRLLKNDAFPFEINNQDVWTMFHSYQFDFSVWEMYGALLYGGKLVIVPPAVTKDSFEFLELLERENVTILNQVPSSFYELMHAESFREVPKLALKYLIFGGEALNPRKLQDWYARYPQTKIVNMYGITETTVHVTYKEITQKEIEKGVSNIGKAIPTLNVYIMNGEQLCGIGMLGEICVAGAGVARGYLHRKELTAAKFVANPFNPNERMYRSGDLARWLPDGSLEYIGRMDQQVKIHGFRIELGEIENAIRKQPLIRDVAVITQVDEAGDPRLCAYIVQEDEGETLDATKIKDELRHDLPDYMIPMHIVSMDRLPVTSNGKLNRAALPKPPSQSKEEYVAPSNEKEALLAEVIGTILGVEQVGIEDNFFELGGDSIKAIRVISKLREAAYELTVKDLIFERKIRLIADKMEKVENGLSAYPQEEVTGEVPFTPIQDRFMQWSLAKPDHYNQALMVRAHKRLDLQVLQKALTELVHHHDSLRTVFIEGKQHILRSEESKLFDLEVYDFTNIVDDRERTERCEQQANQLQKSIDLQAGPLVKVGLFQMPDADQVLLCIHHLVVDGVSWRILLEDLQTAYEQQEQEGSSQLPMKTASYQQWAYALKEYANSEQVELEIPYWQEVLAEAEGGKLRDVEVKTAGEYPTFQIEMDPEHTEKLLHEAGESYHTEINDLLLTALSRAVHQWKGQKVVSVELEGHGREPIHKQMEIDRTVGWFTSLYPVVLHTEENDISRDIIDTKEMLRRVPNHGLVYGVIQQWRKEVLPEIHADICFNYLGQIDSEVSEASLFTLADNPVGESSASENHYPNAITMNTSIVNGQFVMEFIYHNGSFAHEQMLGFAEWYKKSLIEIIEHCITKEDTQQTASDFGDTDLEMDELDEIMKHFN